MERFDLYVDSHGNLRCLYTEALDLTVLGALSVSRASHVEPDARGGWSADLSPAGGPVLGPYSVRSQALGAESAWLGQNILPPPP